MFSIQGGFKMRTFHIGSSVALLLFAGLALSPVRAEDRLQWFQNDKFGMFIHWGPYSLLAGEWKGQRVPVGTEAEWIMQRFNIPVTEYREDGAPHESRCASTRRNGWRWPKPPG